MALAPILARNAQRDGGASDAAAAATALADAATKKAAFEAKELEAIALRNQYEGATQEEK